MGKYYYLKGNGWGCGVWIVLFFLFLTSPIWFYLLSIPLGFLTFLGEIGVKLFGEGNGAIMLILLGIVFMFLLIIVAKFIERREREKKEKL